MLLNNDVDEICPDTYFVKETHFFGRRDSVELKPGGAAILVTNDNKEEYCQLAARHTMTTAIKAAVIAFQRGLWEVPLPSLSCSPSCFPSCLLSSLVHSGALPLGLEWCVRVVLI